MQRKENISTTLRTLWALLSCSILGLGCAAASETPAPKVVKVEQKEVQKSAEADTVTLEARKVCEDAAREKIKRARGVSYCYEKELPRNPNLAGEVVALLKIDAAGKLSALSISNSTLDNDNVQNCILKKMKRVTFASCPEGGALELTYPWAFKSGR
ncbi:MAG: AgmX/PglI C-terminal domain-containing protein [Myxococcota bacterium]|jgi:hypothetical protein|nr:AgmX/PglI C-terminal domain-containing protein [Myxococcota bacterium]